MLKQAQITLLKTWPEVKFPTGPGWVLASETFANREVGGRAYREVLVACLRSKYPPRAPRRQYSQQSHPLVTLGAMALISYAAFMREISDEKLMQQYAKGNAKAFDELYARHRTPLYRYFNRQVNDAATANDLYQGAWEKIIKARGKYRPTSPFTAWMYRIAHNHLVDHYRAAKPAVRTEMETLTDKQAEPAELAIDGQQRQNLQEKIATLPPEQRNTLLLKLETGLKMEEIATVTGASRETVKSRLRYAVDKLKRSLVE